MSTTSLVTPMLGAVAAFTAACGLAAPPNIVVFISDDHGYLDSQTAASKDIRTPHMLRLAERGMTFTHAFAASPSCAPSRAALLTGLMPARNGSMLNHQPPRAEVKKLPAYLQELGYEVVALGKVAHYEQAKFYGFDHASHDTFHDAEAIPAALTYLRERKSKKPLCFLVGTNWPHVPWPEVEPDAAAEAALTLPPAHVDTAETRHWRARYYAAVEKMDADLGQVFDAAYERLGENTLFIHFSDHGAQWPFGKWNLYDAGIRVPFFAVWPGVIEPKSKSEAMISLVDVLPTLIESAGGEPPQEIDGRSRLSVFRGESTTAREYLFTTHSGDGRMNAYPMRAVRFESEGTTWKYIRNLRPDGEFHTHIDKGKAVDGNKYWASWVDNAKSVMASQKIVDRYVHRPAEELYELRGDPHEQYNRAVATRTIRQVPAGVLDHARKQLDEWMRNQGDAGLAAEKANADAFLKLESAEDG